MTPDFKVVIPARMGSSRFYGKPLAMIAGRPMVLRVVEQALKAGASDVVVATDHADIAQLVSSAGYTVHMTHADHASGTDRIAQVVCERGWQDDAVVVNVQGDEPAIDPQLIRAVAQQLHAAPQCVMSTAAHPIKSSADFLNPNVVKVVLDQQAQALYFSRAPIPYPRDAYQTLANQPLLESFDALRHMGIYAYRVGFLKQYGQLNASPLEQLESLEQLRVLSHGYKIAVHISPNMAAQGVDLPEDVALVEAFLAQTGQ